MSEDVTLTTEGGGLSVEDRVTLGGFELRKVVADKILQLFIRANIFVLAFIFVVLISDWIQLGAGVAHAEQRLINSNVIIALLGATTVQVGTIVVSISVYLFPKR